MAIGLGAGCPGEAAGCPAGAGGLAEWSCCCFDWTQWSNSTYIQKKTKTGYMYWAERRVRFALQWLFPEELEGLAYDASASSPVLLPSYLIEAGAEAHRNWYDLKPFERWVKNGRGASTDCTSVGYYRYWTPTGPFDPALALAAMERLTGKFGDAAKLAWMGDLAPILGLDGAPGSLALRLNDVVLLAPGNEPQRLIKELAPRESFVVIVNGVVTPTPWMVSFLEIMAPVAMARRRREAVRMTSSGREILRAQATAAMLASMRASLVRKRLAFAREEEELPADDPSLDHPRTTTRISTPSSDGKSWLPYLIVASSGAFLIYSGYRVWRKRSSGVR